MTPPPAAPTAPPPTRTGAPAPAVGGPRAGTRADRPTPGARIEAGISRLVGRMPATRAVDPYAGAEDLIEQRQIHLVLLLAPIANVVHAIAIAFVGVEVLPPGLGAARWAWTLTALTVTGLSMVLWLPRAFDLDRPPGRGLVWGLRAEVTTWGVLYGVLVAWSLPLVGPDTGTLVVAFTSGVLGAGAFALCGSRDISLWWVAVMLVTLTTAFAVVDGPTSTRLIAMLWFYGTALAIGTEAMTRTIEGRIRAELAAAREGEQVRLLLDDLEGGVQEWFWHADADGLLERPSARLVDASGIPAPLLARRSLADLLGELRAPTDSGDGPERIAQAVRDSRPFRAVEVAVTVDGEMRWWSMSGAPRLDPRTGTITWRGTGTDVTEARRQHDAIVRLANHDALTGLANRHRFTRDLAEMVERCDPSEEVWLAIVDLDGFKMVNDTHGHPMGDVLLEAVARRLRSRAGDGALVARLGGDEFALALTAPHGAESRVRGQVERTLRSINEPYRIGSILLRVGCSAGLAAAPRDGAGVDELVVAADLALYDAKGRDDASRSPVTRFDHGMRTRAIARAELQHDIAAALGTDQLRLVYQPVVRADDGAVVGVEALARWAHPERGLVLPGEFIPAAEKAGLIRDLGVEVLRLACRDARSLPAPLSVAVNVSPLQLTGRDVEAELWSAISGSGIDPARVTLEITETALVDPGAVTALSHLREHGVRIAIDDFGTGYSSFAALGTLPLDTLKIDRSFVTGLVDDGDASAHAVVAAMVEVARAFALDVTAEGVETAAEAAALRALGCTNLQGYFLARPMWLPDLLAHLAADAAPEGRGQVHLVGAAGAPRADLHFP